MGRTGRRRFGAVLLAAAALTAACTSSNSHRSSAPASPPSSSPPSSSAASVPPLPASSTPVTRTPSPTHRAPTEAAAKKTQPVHTSAPAKAKAKAGRLPLDYSTGDATQVVTVEAPSTSSTEGTLQAWRKSGNGWLKVGDSVPAYLGSDGLSKHPSESRSATPIGSFTLTQAFGRDTDPGTSLPYTKTTPDDWWISEPGSLYNTRQRCSSKCDFDRGAPNEHLYYETPYYRYAVAIDYNTRNAPGGVKQGAGSAFFLHVTVGAPTAGCVSINQDQLVRILRWLSPSRHPRIMIGTG